jgi:FkbM family methyltransferase
MYSQNNEEEIILNYFGSRIGTFLDLGAYDGVRLSNVRALAELGWSGVMVEASPKVFQQLKKNYQGFDRVLLFNVAVGEKSGLMRFYDNDQAVGTLHKKETERWGDQQFQPISLYCIEINQFLRSNSFVPAYDFISCDVEGEDLAIMERLDLKKLGTRMVCVEFNGKGEEQFSRAICRHGLKLLHRNNENLIYAL